MQAVVIFFFRFVGDMAQIDHPTDFGDAQHFEYGLVGSVTVIESVLSVHDIERVARVVGRQFFGMTASGAHQGQPARKRQPIVFIAQGVAGLKINRFSVPLLAEDGHRPRTHVQYARRLAAAVPFADIRIQLGIRVDSRRIVIRPLQALRLQPGFPKGDFRMQRFLPSLVAGFVIGVGHDL